MVPAVFWNTRNYIPLDPPLLLYAQFKHSGVYSEVLKLEVDGTKVMTESDQVKLECVGMKVTDISAKATSLFSEEFILLITPIQVLKTSTISLEAPPPSQLLELHHTIK